MDEFMKMLEKAMKEGKVCVVQIDNEPEQETEPEKVAESKVLAEKMDTAAEIATLNKMLYDAHIGVGFTSDEALALTVATITCK